MSAKHSDVFITMLQIYHINNSALVVVRGSVIDFDYWFFVYIKSDWSVGGICILRIAHNF